MVGRGAVLALMGVLACSGCGVVSAEEHDRGGFVDKVADDHLVRAATKQTRVLRSMAILATLTNIAAAQVKGQDNALSLLKKVDAASYDIGTAYAVAQTSAGAAACAISVSDGTTTVSKAACYDPTFDLHMKVVVDDLFRVAALGLPTKDLSGLISAMSGNWVADLGLFIKLFGTAVNDTRTGFAGYRDLMDQSAAIVVRGNGGSPVAQAYDSTHGDGDFRAYAAAVDAALASPGATPVDIKEGDFVPWLYEIEYTCWSSAWDVLANRSLNDPTDGPVKCSDPITRFKNGQTQYGSWDAAAPAAPEGAMPLGAVGGAEPPPPGGGGGGGSTERN